MPSDKTIKLGHPSYIWGAGQERRLSLMKKYVDFKNKKILDVGCGIGMYVKKFSEYSDQVYGVDVDKIKIKETKKNLPKVKFEVAPAEKLPYPDNYFDIILLHEVIEHVDDDKRAIQEAYRVLVSGGQMIIFVPNRWWFFETHGFFLGKKYRFRLLPFVNWLPMPIRNKFCHHVRIYTKRSLKKLFSGLDVKYDVLTCIYPGFDKISYRYPKLGPILKKTFYFLEKTPLNSFGLSVFAVVKKVK